MRISSAPMGPWLPTLALVALISTAAAGCGSEDPASPAIPSAPATRLTTPHIAFSSSRSGSIGIHLYDLSTGHIARLSPPGVFEQDPAISPDGARIAFTPYHSEGRFHLMTMAVDGSDRRLCTNDSSASDTGPHWSPDSRYLLFTRTDRATAAHDVYVVRADGDSLTRITWNTHSAALDWSPDGTRLLFLRDSTSFGFTTYDVTSCDRDGSHAASLYGTVPWKAVGADYSADGRYIVVACEGLSASPRLALSNANGTGFTPIGGETDFAPVGGIGHPSWSPDGMSVVYSGHDPGLSDDVYTVYVPNGSAPAPLFTGTPWEYAADWGPKP